MFDSRIAVEYAEKYGRLAQWARSEAKKWRCESEIWENQSIGAAEAYEQVAMDMYQLAVELDGDREEDTNG